MLNEAEECLKEITPADQSRTEVSNVRLNLYMAAKKWAFAARVAAQLVETEPENVSAWINLAYSLRRSEGLDQAEAVLLRAHTLHPDYALIFYNLACYASVTSRIEDAKERLQRAFELDEDLRAMAIEDLDLRPLRDWIRLSQSQE